MTWRQAFSTVVILPMLAAIWGSVFLAVQTTALSGMGTLSVLLLLVLPAIAVFLSYSIMRAGMQVGQQNASVRSSVTTMGQIAPIIWRLGETFMRLIALGIVWGTALILGYFVARLAPGWPMYLLVSVVCFIGGLVASNRILRSHPKLDDRQTQAASYSSKAKANSLSVREMFALLDDDELEDDLRDVIKETLRARIRRLSDIEAVDSFEDLLAEAGAKRKQGER